MQQNKKWVAFTCHSPLIRRVTSLLKQTNLNITFWAASAIHQQLTEKPAHKNPSAIYRLGCNTCSNVYVGQSGRSITVRHGEHVRCVRTSNPTSAYALHILENKYEYGTAAETLELLKPCYKGTRMNCWETFCMQAFHQHKLLINEQQISDINPLCKLADMSQILLQKRPLTQSHSAQHTTHMPLIGKPAHIFTCLLAYLFAFCIHALYLLMYILKNTFLLQTCCHPTT
jgi:hypothetical protein